MRGFTLAFAATILAGCATGTQEFAEERWLCADDRADGKARIVACSTVVNSGGESEKGRAEAYFNRGVALLKEKDFDPAIADFNVAIPLDPMNAEAHYQRGYAWHAKHDHKRAIADYDSAIRLKPDHAYAYVNRGFAKRASGDKKGALDDLNIAAELAPTSARIHYAHGAVLHNLGDDVRAIAAYSSALRLDPTLSSARYYRGRLLQVKGDFLQAIADFQDVQFIDAKLQAGRVLDAIAYYVRGGELEERGELDRAIDEYTIAIGLDPYFPQAYARRGNAWAAKGSFKPAIADYDLALLRDPKQALAHNGKGLARFGEGLYASALWYFERKAALDTGDAYAPLWAYLANARNGRTERGRLREAAQNIDRAVWPGPVIALFLGELTPEQLRIAARDADQTCEAGFYIGQFDFIAGRSEPALAAMREAARQCPARFIERQVAIAELRRAGETPPTR